MNFFYCCGSGVHASVIAASAHLGILKGEEYSKRNVLSLPFFDLPPSQISGRPLFLGKDEEGNGVYTLPVMNKKKICFKIIRGFSDLFGIPREEMILIDCEKYVSPLINQLHIFRTLPGMKSLSRKLILILLKNAYFKLISQGRKARRADSGRPFAKA